jgi:hypothetical protein
MSHYTVLVVTKDGDYESALAPFDERIEVEPYVRETKEELIEKEKERFKNYLKRAWKGEDVSSFEECHPDSLDWNDDKAILNNWFKQTKTDNSEKITSVLNVYNKLNIKGQTEQEIEKYFSKGLQELEQINVPNERKEPLRKFVNQLLGRNH